MTDSSQHDLRIRSTRRHFFRDCGVGVGKIALASLLSQSLSPSSNLYAENAVRPTAPKPPHFKPRAKRVIFLFMAGAPSQLDLFDHKPKLAELEGKPIPDFPQAVRANGLPGSGFDYDQVNRELESQGLAIQYIGNKYGNLTDSDSKALTYIMTYHSVKGLDFETVFMPFLDEDQTFWRDGSDIERRLFFVAATRSRRNLFLSYSSLNPHRLVQQMPQNLLNHVKCMKTEISAAAEEEFSF